MIVKPSRSHFEASRVSPAQGTERDCLGSIIAGLFRKLGAAIFRRFPNV